MKKQLIFLYKQLSLNIKLLIPVVLAVLSGIILTIIIVKNVGEINKNTVLLNNRLVPTLEKTTNNRALLKKISETLTFAVLAEDEDMLFEISDNLTIEKNLKEIMVNQEVNLTEAEDTLNSFTAYYKVATEYTLNSINDELLNSERKSEELLSKYNEVECAFLGLQERVKKEISSTIQLIDKITKQLIFFTVVYIFIFSLGLFYISYIIYKDFNKRFNKLNKNLDVLGVKKTLFSNRDVLDTLSHSIDQTIENYEVINTQREALVSINQNIQNSIEYASLIQEAILPSKEVLNGYTKDNFVFLQQKDTVGGDIYLIAELESKDEVLIMVIDGVGHGVSGAFLTILVKAIESQIVAKINRKTLEPSPAKILAYFNQEIKTILQQERGSKSNVGFDGGVLYYNRATNICKYAGAKTPLYIINDNHLSVIKSERKSVGFVRTKNNQHYTEYDVEIKEHTKLYICTDGIIDQEGKESSRYGVEQFKNFLTTNHTMPFSEQLALLQASLQKFQGALKQSDDITVVGLQFK